ncbi:hypothetical protein PQR34_42775 [Paraburkholderia sediminicola]|uniref:hypothetical protein n=1 Tax=Paraburkholderia sediminicola TaxID=458836 RepID=UPI0038BE0ECE
MPEADRVAMATTMGQRAAHCEIDARKHLKSIRLAGQSRRQVEAGDGDSDDEWRILAPAHCALIQGI